MRTASRSTMRGAGSGKHADAGIGMAVDLSGHGYITGATFSGNLTTKNAAVSSYNSAASTVKVSNVFVAEFNPTVSGAASPLYATYLGGSGTTAPLIFSALLFFRSRSETSAPRSESTQPPATSGSQD